jgi:hypothetical protein
MSKLFKTRILFYWAFVNIKFNAVLKFAVTVKVEGLTHDIHNQEIVDIVS